MMPLEHNRCEDEGGNENYRYEEGFLELLQNKTGLLEDVFFSVCDVATNMLVNPQTKRHYMELFAASENRLKNQAARTSRELCLKRTFNSQNEVLSVLNDCN